MVKKEYKLEGLSCSSCASKIEGHMNKLDSVASAQINMINQTLTVFAEESDKLPEDDTVTSIVHGVEPNVKVEKVNPLSPLEPNNRKPKRHIDILFWLGILLAIIGYVLDWDKRDAMPVITTILFFQAYAALGYKVVWNAILNIFKGSLLDEKFLMTFATISAFALGQYPEAVGVMLFYEIGNRLEGIAVSRSQRSITSLLDLKPTIAHLIGTESIQDVEPAQVKVGDSILVKPGERVPFDGTLLKGDTYLDLSALTGESLPIFKNVNSEILSGSVNLNQAIEMRVNKPFENSFVSRIMEMVQDAAARKSQSETMIHRLAVYYTPIVVGLAVLVAVIPPLFLHASFHLWFYRALVFLVISCPCALVISIPLAFFGGIGAASRHGILMKGGNYLEAIRKMDTIVFDKTGTLTTGKLSIRKIAPIAGITETELLETAAYADSYSNHPIAMTIRNAYNREINTTQIESYEEKPGMGAIAVWEGVRILAGNAKLMAEAGIAISRDSHNQTLVVDEKEGLLTRTATGTLIHIAAAGRYLGYIQIGDDMRKEAKETIQSLKHHGVKKMIILSGDGQENVRDLAQTLGIDQYYAELLPEGKLAKMDEIVKNAEGMVAFVGDGINDAPVLMRADVGIAMGGIGSDAAIEAADVVLMRDDLKRIPVSMNISNYTNRIVWQNIIFALGVKALIMALGTIGIATLWMAVFADVGVAMIAILNSVRILRSNSF
ncbi:MAG TPA: heavy metal translocating P-type ATPase [Candidatus Cloacimonadota bacterium]|nr:heavy metal translocating P-type ATPase [Candidatus Cloacimonadota bacterium]